MSGGLGSRTTTPLEEWLQDNDPVTAGEDAYLVGAAVVEKAMRCVGAEEALRQTLDAILVLAKDSDFSESERLRAIQFQAGATIEHRRLDSRPPAVAESSVNAEAPGVGNDPETGAVAAGVRAEEALRRAEDVVEAARTTLEYPDAVDARQSLEMALGAYDYIAAAVPEESKPASDFEGADTDCRGHSLDRPT